MPHDAVNNIWYGDEARKPRTAAREALVAFVKAKLNDPDGPYYAILGLNNDPAVGEIVEAVVTASRDTANQQSDGKNSNPVVFFVNSSATSEPSERVINDVRYKGKLHFFTFRIDMGVNQDTTDEEEPDLEDESEADCILGDQVTAVIEEGFFELSDAGLQEAAIEADKEGEGINPHSLTIAFPAFPTYTPEAP